MPATDAPEVTITNYVRAESDLQMRGYVEQMDCFGRFVHVRAPYDVHHQVTVRANRDTLYSWGVFDLTTPLTVHLPESDGRYQSLMTVSQDHSVEAHYSPATVTLTTDNIGTRYVTLVVRTFADPDDEDDLARIERLEQRRHRGDGYVVVELLTLRDGVDDIDPVAVEFVGEALHVTADDGGVQVPTHRIGQFSAGSQKFVAHVPEFVASVVRDDEDVTHSALTPASRRTVSSSAAVSSALPSKMVASDSLSGFAIPASVRSSSTSEGSRSRSDSV